jgi:hypothetical protein
MRALLEELDRLEVSARAADNRLRVSTGYRVRMDSHREIARVHRAIAKVLEDIVVLEEGGK